MPSTTKGSTRLDHIFAASGARLHLWRELNTAAQTWAASVRSGNPRAGRAAVEAALAEVRPLEDFFLSRYLCSVCSSLHWHRGRNT